MHSVIFMAMLALFDCNWKGEEPWIKSPSREKDKTLLIHYMHLERLAERSSMPLFSLSGYNFGWCLVVSQGFQNVLKTDDTTKNDYLCLLY